jgi:opacity protein-like surface antigen
MTRAAVALFLIALVGPFTLAHAQTRPPANRPPVARPSPQPTFSVRGFGDVGVTTFTASESFTAVLGSASGVVFGGGAEVVLRSKIFAAIDVSRFTKDGERVFIFNGERFPLGIDTTVTVTPVLLTAGYRFGARRTALVPFVGGGVGWHRYEETSEFADDDDNVTETHVGYHVVGGVEYRLARLFAVAGGVQWATVPDGLGQTPSSVSAAFDETDLGGVTLRVRFVVGR